MIISNKETLKAFDRMMLNIATMPVIYNEEVAKAFVDGCHEYFESEGRANSTNVKAFTGIANESCRMASDAIYGYQNQILDGQPLAKDASGERIRKKSFKINEYRQKALGGALTNPFTGVATVAAFASEGNEADFDNGWRMAFAADDLTRGTKGLLYDTINRVEFREYDIGKPIEPSPLYKTTWDGYGRIFYGAGVVIDYQQMQIDPLYSSNKILAAMRYKYVVKQSDVAYSVIAAAAAAASGAGQTQAFTTNLAKTLNLAIVEAKKLNRGKGYELGDNVPMVLFANEAHKFEIEATFNTISGNNGNNILAPTNVQRVYTAKLEPDLGTGTNCALFAVPGRRIRHGDFMPLTFRTGSNAQSFTEGVYAGYMDNNIAETDQFYIANLTV